MDLILTDYIDGQVDQNTAESVQSHLRNCSDCAAFLKEVKDTGVVPFQQGALQPVPAELWDAVRQGIEEEKTNPLEDLIDRMRGWMVFPRMVPIVASFVVMFLVGSVTVNTIQIQQAKEKEQGEYLVSLLSPQGNASPGDNNDLGTPIEHYFL
jgi:predicted anti-sigma-YlaC factor YlaD